MFDLIKEMESCNKIQPLRILDDKTIVGNLGIVEEEVFQSKYGQACVPISNISATLEEIEKYLNPEVKDVS